MRATCLAVVCFLSMASAGYAQVQPGTVLGEQKISDTQGGFTGALSNSDEFGVALSPIEDLDGDGVVDLAVGAFGDDDGGPTRGALWVLFLNSDGSVKDHQKISDTEGGFTGGLSDDDEFGVSVAGLGDLDGDGVADLAVGAHHDDDGGPNRGAVWVLFLNPDGSVKGYQKISNSHGLFTGLLDDNDRFGASLAALGDLDGDNVVDLAVGANFDSDGGPRRGAVWVLFLNIDGTVKGQQKINDSNGGFSGTLHDGDQFGESVATLGDLDEDGVVDLAVGARLDDDGGNGRGAAWVLLLDSDGTVKGQQKISDTEGGFGGTLDDGDDFGTSVAGLGDLDADGVLDMAVGARQDDDGGPNRGAVWVLFLNTDGTVAGHQKISATEGEFAGALHDSGEFGIELAALGDLDGDGVGELAVGNAKDDDGGARRGAVWILFLDGGPPPCGEISGYCDSTINSTGHPATIGMHGSLSVAMNDTTLDVIHCPTGSFGVFFYGLGQTQYPLGDGYLCVSPYAPGLFRLMPVVETDLAGRSGFALDFQALPPAGQIAGDSTWNFQFWYRDLAAAGTGSNLSNAVRVTFCN